MLKKIKVGLALGGGGARGFAHIGVLKALEEADIEVSYLSGISMGAIMAAGYAHKKNLKRLEKHVLDFKYLDFVKPHKQDILMDINKITAYFDKYLGNSNFSDLQIPLQVLTTDLREMRGFVINKGKVSKAIAASSTTPYIHKPIQYDDRLLVDGGLISDVPIELVDHPDIDMIIGVKVTTKAKFDEQDNLHMSNFQKMMIAKFPPISLLWYKQINNYMKHSKKIVNNELAELRVSMIRKPLLMIEPELGNINTLSFEKAHEAIEAGYVTTVKALNTDNNILDYQRIIDRGSLHPTL